MENFELDTYVEISQQDISDIDFFIENYLINAMNESGMSFAAMSVILQTIIEKRDELKNWFEENSNMVGDIE